MAGCGTAEGPGQGQSLRMSPAGPTPATLPWLSVHSCRASCGTVVLQAHPHFTHEKSPGRELMQSTTGRRQPGPERRSVESPPAPPQGPKRRRGTDPRSYRRIPPTAPRQGQLLCGECGAGRDILAEPRPPYQSADMVRSVRLPQASPQPRLPGPSVVSSRRESSLQAILSSSSQGW